MSNLAQTLNNNSYDSRNTIGPRQATILAFLGSVKVDQTIRTIRDFLNVADGSARQAIASLRARGLLTYDGRAKLDYRVKLTVAGEVLAKQLSKSSVGENVGLVCCKAPTIRKR